MGRRHRGASRLPAQAATDALGDVQPHPGAIRRAGKRRGCAMGRSHHDQVRPVMREARLTILRLLRRPAWAIGSDRPVFPGNGQTLRDALVKGFGCRPIDERSARHWGRRPKASREGTRERWAARVPQALWGFGRGGPGGGGGIGAWALSIAAVGERVWTGCSTDSGTRRP